MLSKKDIATCFNGKENLRSLLIRKKESHVPVIDSFRALSFLWVFGFHTLYILRYFLPDETIASFYKQTSSLTFLWRGSMGVDVFFVISGFLISLILMEEYDKSGKIAIGNFYKRRFLRLMPVYYLALLVILVGYPPEFEPFQSKNGAASWSNFLYVNNYVSYENQFMLWSWSLAVEEQFYLIYPLLFVLLIRKPRVFLAVLVVTFLVSGGFRWMHSANVLLESPSFVKLLDVHSSYFDSIYDKLHMRMGAIVCGILAAVCYRRYRSTLSAFVLRKNALVVIVIELGLIAGLYVLAVYSNTEGFVGKLYLSQYRNMFSLLFTMLLVLYLCADSKQTIFRRLLTSKVWYPLAHLSYTNYIWHPMVLFTFYFLLWRGDQHLSGADIAIVIATSYLVTMLLSVLSFVYVEKPFMRMRKFV